MRDINDKNITNEPVLLFLRGLLKRGTTHRCGAAKIGNFAFNAALFLRYLRCMSTLVLHYLRIFHLHVVEPLNQRC